MPQEALQSVGTSAENLHARISNLGWRHAEMDPALHKVRTTLPIFVNHLNNTTLYIMSSDAMQRREPGKEIVHASKVFI